MNVKITSRFILTIVVVNILIFFINIIVGFSTMMKNEAYGFNFLKPITYENKKLIQKLLLESLEKTYI